MGALAKFLLILDKLVKSGVIKKAPQAIKFAEQQFGKVTPLLKKQIEKVFESAKKPVVGKPGKKEGAVIPMVKEGTKKTEGIETLDEFNLSKDDPMGDFEKIVKGEGDTGLPSQFTNKDIEEAIDNVSPGFVSGDTKYNAELVAEELAVSKGIDYYGLPVKDRAQIYGRAFDGLSKQRMKGELSKTDELMNFFRKEIEKADAPKLDSKENVQLGIEKLRNPKRPGGPLDPAIGVTRTLARRVLEKRGIEIGKKDPIDVFNDTFGEAIIDLKNLGEEMIEADQTGRNLKPMDDLLEIEGFFDMEIPENPNKGIPNEEMIEMLEKDLEEKKILEDFDPTFRKPNAEGGLMRTNYAQGSEYIRKRPNFFKDLFLERKGGGGRDYMLPMEASERKDLNEAFIFANNDMAKAEELEAEKIFPVLQDKTMEILDVVLDMPDSEEKDKILYDINHGILNKQKDSGMTGIANARYETIQKYGYLLNDKQRDLGSMTTRKPNAEGGLMRTKLAMGSDDEPLKPDPTKPINPFAPKPTGPVLPDKSMMAGTDTPEIEIEILQELLELFREKYNRDPVSIDELKRAIGQMRNKSATGGRVQAASGGLAEILKV